MGRMAEVLLAQRGHLVGWVPVCLGPGIGCYFAVTAEPGPLGWGLVGLGALVLTVLAWRLPEAVSPLALGAALCLAGFLLAGVRAQMVAGPVLGWRYYGPVEGRIVAIDRSQSDAPRLTLDRVRLDRVPPHRTPLRVRLSLHGDGAKRFDPEPGARVMTTAHLSPPSGPVEPGGFDFQRHAWFERLGAVGYTRVPVLLAARADGSALRVFRLRMAASEHVRARLPGDVGGFAAALTTGDRSGMSRAALEDLRASNLAHLLAISGLHMGLLTAVVFGALRLILAMIPAVALRWPTKAIAACGALVAATGYLALSGGNVATERAYIMVAVALGALMLGRRALSLRAVAVAATLVLILRPEALTGPGFQMSFAATTALVAVFGLLRGAEAAWLPRWLRPTFAVFVSSAVAGAATAPIAAAHFNVIAHYGLAANLASVPLMGVLVIPAAVLALVLAPLGLDWMAFWAMGWGLRWILGVAHFTAGLEGAQGHVPGPGPLVLPLLALGGLVLLLWQGRLRWVGLTGVAAAIWLWQGAARPALLIADSGTLVGMMTPEGRALSREKTAGFVARNWLENDGDGVAQWIAAGRWQEGAVIHLSGKRALAGFAGCKGGQVVVVSVPAPAPPGLSCLWFDPGSLRETGAVALEPQAEGWKITTARALTGDRPWTRWPEVRDERRHVRRASPDLGDEG